MLISIITVNLNNRDGLERTLSSVFNQENTDFKAIEVIVIDGGSVDGSTHVIDSFKEKISFWVSENDQGVYDAMNKGVQSANGEYLWFLNSGDYLSHSQALKIFLDTLEKERTSDLIYCNTILENTHGRRKLEHPNKIDFSYLTLKMLNHQSYVLKRKYFQVPAPFNIEYRIVADWVFLFELFIKFRLRSHKITDYLVVYNTEGISITNGNLWIQERDGYLRKRYSQWEMESIEILARLRSKPYYNLLVATLDSPKRTVLLDFFLRLLYPKTIK